MATDGRILPTEHSHCDYVSRLVFKKAAILFVLLLLGYGLFITLRDVVDPLARELNKPEFKHKYIYSYSNRQFYFVTFSNVFRTSCNPIPRSTPQGVYRFKMSTANCYYPIK